MLQNSFSLSNLSSNVDNDNGGSLVAAVAAWQRQRWWQRWQRCGGSGSGGSLVVTWRQTRQHGDGNSLVVGAVWRQKRGSIGVMVAAQQRWWRYQCCEVAAWQHDGGNMRTRGYKVCDYKTEDEAELMEKNFGDEGEDDDTFRGQLA